MRSRRKLILIVVLGLCGQVQGRSGAAFMPGLDLAADRIKAVESGAVASLSLKDIVKDCQTPEQQQQALQKLACPKAMTVILAAQNKLKNLYWAKQVLPATAEQLRDMVVAKYGSMPTIIKFVKDVVLEEQALQAAGSNAMQVYAGSMTPDEKMVVLPQLNDVMATCASGQRTLAELMLIAEKFWKA